jgi:transcriptional regulator with XRE-family HTH domain
MRPLPVSAPAERAAIGRRLRSTRQSKHLTIEQVASSTGLTKGFISRIERDLTSPSVSTLIQLCDVLGIEIGALFAHTDAQFVPLDSAPKIDLGGAGAAERLVSPRREERVQVVRSRVEPAGNGGPEFYTVSAELDLVHVLRGSIRIAFTDAEWTLVAGDTLTFDGRQPHNWWADDGEGADLLWVLLPGSGTGPS